MMNPYPWFKSHRVEIILFCCLWLYIIFRSFLVFYIHDEIVTKYAYMIDWNYAPYEGYIDANNHFLNSLLGGFFIRLFQSDAMWVVRLANVIFFPLFFWSAAGFKRQFQHRANYYFFLVSITGIVYVLDFFSLARGYGISWAFMLFALLQSFYYLKSINNLRAIAILLAWLLCIYANLSYLFIACFGLLYLFLHSLLKRKFVPALVLALGFLPIYLFVRYAFHLKSLNKLYLGDPESFIDTTIHSLSNFIFHHESLFLDASVIIIFTIILIGLIRKLISSKSLFQAKHLFQSFLLVAVLAIFMQNYLLGVNFPEGRAAVHLVFFFLGGLAFTLDNFRIKYLGWGLSIGTFILFTSQFNFTHTQGYFYEHFDEQLLSKIPMMTKGIPTSTAGRFWQMDNELARTKGYPARIFQDIRGQKKVFQDYIIQLEEFKEERPEVIALYDEVYVDPISRLTLFKRKELLDREKIFGSKVELDGNQAYYDLIKDHPSVPSFIRCKGKIERASIYDNYEIIFAAVDSLGQEKFSYGGLNPVTSTSINSDGSISFDFTYTINNFEEADKIVAYLWNKNQQHLKGKIEVEIYLISL